MCDLVLPSLGEDASEFLPERNLLLRHGTSLSLMSLVGTALNESEEFAEIDVSADWEKWSTRRPDFSLYYAALLDPAATGEGLRSGDRRWVDQYFEFSCSLGLDYSGEWESDPQRVRFTVLDATIGLDPATLPADDLGAIRVTPPKPEP